MGDLGERLAKMSPERRQYALETLPSHLAEASQVERLHRLLTDFDFIEAKLEALGIQPLIEDYDLAISSDSPDHKSPSFSSPLTPPTSRAKGGVEGNAFVLGEPRDILHEKASTLKLIQGALRLSAHVLAKDKTQLAGQLLGRLLSFEVPAIQAMLMQAKPRKSLWLRPLMPCLIPPGGALVRTLTGHSDAVIAVAVTPDGKRVISGSNDQTLKVWNLETGEELFTLTGHTRGVTAVAVTPDGNGRFQVREIRHSKSGIWKREKNFSPLANMAVQ
jgi:WD40 repeat protein